MQGEAGMEGIRVLVAENQVVVRQQLVQELNRDNQIEIVGITDNGKEAYEIFEREEPQLIIFDLLLPIYDGYTLLDKIKQHGIKEEQKLIMTTPLTTDLLVSEAFRQGVDYVLTKPYDASAAAIQIRKIYNRMNEITTLKSNYYGKEVETNIRRGKEMGNERIYNMKEFNVTYHKLDEIISKRLDEIGVPMRLKGYRYMITAVKEVLSDDGKLESVTKILYPDVARKHNSTPQRVEKAIRHAIEVAWITEEENPIHKEFHYMMSTGKERPTNSEFIAKLTQDVRMKYYKQVAC